MSSVQIVFIAAQALSAVAIAVWTIRLYAVTRTQSQIQAKQAEMERRRDRYAWAPIVVSPSGGFYRSPDTSGEGEKLSNIGPATALDMSATLVRDPKDLGDMERVAVDLNKVHLTRRQGAGLASGGDEYARYVQDGLHRGEFIVIHYKDIFGEAWHTTFNVRDSKSWGTTSSDRVWVPWDTPRIVAENCIECRAERERAPREGKV